MDESKSCMIDTTHTQKKPYLDQTARVYFVRSLRSYVPVEGGGRARRDGLSGEHLSSNWCAINEGGVSCYAVRPSVVHGTASIGRVPGFHSTVRAFLPSKRTGRGRHRKRRVLTRVNQTHTHHTQKKERLGSCPIKMASTHTDES